MHEDEWKYDFDHERPTLVTRSMDFLFDLMLALQSVVPFFMGAELFLLTPLGGSEAWSAAPWYVRIFGSIIMICRLEQAHRRQAPLLSWVEMGSLIPVGFCFVLCSPLYPYALMVLGVILLSGAWFARQIRGVARTTIPTQAPNSA